MDLVLVRTVPKLQLIAFFLVLHQLVVSIAQVCGSRLPQYSTLAQSSCFLRRNTCTGVTEESRGKPVGRPGFCFAVGKHSAG